MRVLCVKREVPWAVEAATPVRSAALLLGGALLLVCSAGSAETTVQDIEACVARNLPERSGTLRFAVRAWERDGGHVDSRAELLWLRDPAGLSRVLLRLSEPEDTKGTSVLVLQNALRDPDLYVYLPELSKVKRVRKRQLRGPLFGTDFSYEDFERVQGLARKTTVVRLADQHVGERSVYALEIRPERRDSDYERIVTLVDKEFCLPLRMEFYADGGQLRKELTSDPTSIRREGDHYIPYSFVMRDLRDETMTMIRIEHVGIDPGLVAETFTSNALIPIR